MQVKLTKMELRDQQYKLKQLQKYLPTLQLKKAMLQTEVNNTTYELEGLQKKYGDRRSACQAFQSLLSDPEGEVVVQEIAIERVEQRYENIAGAEIPFFEKVHFAPSSYALFDTPLWIDDAIDRGKKLLEVREEIKVVQRKKEILEKELREVSIRVNLFEKILIPRTQGHIKKIKVFLGDQELASVAQAKVAKDKIEKRKREEVAL